MTRAELRAFLDEHRQSAPRASVGLTEGAMAARQWQKVLVEHGYAGRTVPKEYGGFGAAPDLLENIIIDEEFRRAVNLPDMKERYVTLGLEAFTQTPEQFGAFIESEMKKFGDIIRRSGTKVE